MDILAGGEVMILPYASLNGTMTPEENSAALEKVAEIIKQGQLRSIGISNGEQDVAQKPDGKPLHTWR